MIVLVAFWSRIVINPHCSMIHLEALRIVFAVKPHCSMMNLEALRWSEEDCLFQQQQAYIHLQYVVRTNLEPDRSLLSWLGKAPSKAYSSSGSARDLELPGGMTVEYRQQQAMGHLLEVKGKGKTANRELLSWLGKSPPPLPDRCLGFYKSLGLHIVQKDL